MKAARIHNYGEPEVIKLDEIERPLPGDKQILIKMRGSSLNHVDLSVRAGELKLITQFQLPKTLGFDLVGEIVDCGAGVTSFLKGERVAAMTGLSAGGAAEYCCVDQDQAARLPDGLDWSDAAALPLAGCTALQALRGHAHLRAGQRVLVNGASGGVGGYATQLAKLLGARVTAVCREEHFDYARKLGADETVDYRREGGVEAIEEKFDVVFDAAAKLKLDQAKSLVHHGGHFVTTRPEPKQVMEGFVERLRGSFKLSVVMVKPRAGDMALLLSLVAESRLLPCVEQTFPLEAVAEAHQRFESESVCGKILLVA